MKHYFSGKVRAVLLIAVILTAVVVLSTTLLGEGTVGKGVQTVLAPLRSGVRSLASQAETIYNYMFRYESLAAENEMLKNQINQMEKDYRTADVLARENERLRALAQLKEVREDFELVDGYVISWNSGDWTSSFTINRGTNQGIAEGMCAITGDGSVVGLVTETGRNYAVIKSVLDSSLEVSASIASSGYNGMVQGGYATGEEGLLRMDYLPSSAVIRNNDQVITAGSTVYPRGLILGHVVDAGFDETGVAKYALLKPSADIHKLEQVFIITEYSVG